METLSARDREFVALGAALAAHCIPCVKLHVAKARLVGIPDHQIREVIELAEEVRQVPAKAVLEAANEALAHHAGTVPASGTPQKCCG
jgi:AhpD family alkylhydroperoxidase